MARILVADDEQAMRLMVRLACERAGYEVHEAVNAPTAIEAYTRLQPDLLVLDLNMPGGGGEFVLKTLRFGAQKLAPVLVITASMAGTADEIRNAYRVDRALPKPFRIPELTSAIRELLLSRGVAVAPLGAPSAALAAPVPAASAPTMAPVGPASAAAPQAPTAAPTPLASPAPAAPPAEGPSPDAPPPSTASPVPGATPPSAPSSAVPVPPPPPAGDRRP